MAKIALNVRVRTDSGEVTTIADLAARGLITFDTMKTDTRKRNGERHERTAYYAWMPDGSGWEISKTAYLSRTGQKVSF